MSSSIILSAKKVNKIFQDCLFVDGEDVSKKITVEGILVASDFNLDRLNSHKNEIVNMLNELPMEFKQHKQGGGGGWSLLKACNDRHGNLWGEHEQIEWLFKLGIGIDQVKYLMPREMWSVLPDGMPYYVVL